MSFARIQIFGNTCLAKCLVILVTVFFCASVICEISLSKKDKLKAAYLLNFTKFIEWQTLATDKSPHTIRICTDSSNDFIDFFNQMAASVTVGKSKMTASAEAFDTATTCELIYVTQLQTPYQYLGDHTVVVADRDEIAYPNISIVFFEKQNKLRFSIDRENITRSQVNVSSELMKIARIK